MAFSTAPILPQFMLLYSLVLFISSFQTQPDWINYDSRKLMYPESDWFMGFSSRYYKESEDMNEVLKEVKHLSRMELSESVFVSVSSQSTLVIDSENGSTETEFEKTSMTKSSLEAFGMKSETYLDEAKKVAYGFSFVKKRTLAAGYFKQFSRVMSNLKVLMKEIESIVDNEKKYNSLAKAMQMLHDAESYEDILIFLGIRTDDVLMKNERKFYSSVIREKFEEIRTSDNQTIGQRIQYLLDDMANETKNMDFSFAVTPIAYKNTGIPSEFSDYFHQIVQGKASARFKVSESPNAQFKLTGSYWPTEDEIQITLNLHEYDDNEPMFMVFGSSLSLSKQEVLDLGLAYEIKQEGIDLKKHYDILNPTLLNGGMDAQISTQKGSSALIFHEGETMNMYVNVTRPAYLRLINIWSDGTQLSLLENYYIPEEEANQTTQLPFEFEAACPCGTEYIILMAQSEPFGDIELRNEDGFDYIQGDITELLTGIRNYQQQNLVLKDFYFTESGFSITTLPVD